MPSFNKVVLIGRLTRDPEMKYTSSGLGVCRFSIAVDRRFKDQSGERKTDFFNCTAFRQTAEYMQSYVKKGRLVAVEGRVEIDEGTGQDGQPRRFISIVCDQVEALDAQRDGAGSGEPAMGGFAGGGGGGGGSRQAAPADDTNGYYAEEEPAEAAPPPARRGAANAGAPAPAAQGRGGAGAPARGAGGPAAGGQGGGQGAPQRGNAPQGRPQRPAPQPDAYPADDYDDSDPFADD